MPHLVLRIEQHHADGVERIGLAQTVDQWRAAAAPSCRPAAASIRAPACVFKMVSLFAASAVISLTRFLSSSFSCVQVIHVRHPQAHDQPARAAARPSKYARPRFMMALNSSAFPTFTVATRRSTACCKAKQ